MNKEDKELLFKDLCARLPYGVKGNFQNSDDELLKNITITYEYLKPNGMVMKGDIKPYLFPLSSMTKKQVYYIYEHYTDTSICEFNEFYKKFLRNKDDINILFTSCSFLIDCFNKNHFDYRGLIPKDLAIDATGLNIY